jgi:hypothetical protein
MTTLRMITTLETRHRNLKDISLIPEKTSRETYLYLLRIPEKADLRNQQSLMTGALKSRTFSHLKEYH